MIINRKLGRTVAHIAFAIAVASTACAGTTSPTTSWQRGYIDSPFVVADGSAIYFLHSVASTFDQLTVNPDAVPVASYLPNHHGQNGAFWWSADLYVSYHTSNGAWSFPENLGDNVNTEDGECCPWVNAAQTVLLFSRESANGDPAISGSFVATRPTASDPWGVPVRLPGELGDFAATLFQNFHLVPSGNLYFEGPLLGNETLFLALRTGVDSWGPATVIAELQEAGVDLAQPWISDDELTLFYNRRTADGNTALLTSVRANPTATWDAPAMVTTTQFQDAAGQLVWGEPSFASDQAMFFVRFDTSVPEWTAGLLRASVNVDGSYGPPERLNFEPVVTVEVTAGDNQGLIDAILQGNKNTEVNEIRIIPGPNGETEFVFTEPFKNSENALPVITGRFRLRVPGITFRRDQGAADFRLLEMNGEFSDLRLRANEIKDFVAPNNGNGGALLLKGGAILILKRGTTISDCRAKWGGAVSVQGNAEFHSRDVGVRNCRSDEDGGAFNFIGNSSGIVAHTKFDGNEAGGAGSAINVNLNPGSIFIEDCTIRTRAGASVPIQNPNGNVSILDNTFVGGNPQVTSTGSVTMHGNIFKPDSVQNLLVKKQWQIKSACEDFGTNALHSLGYNISTDDSCALVHPTDLPNTDPIVVVDANGIPQPQPGSPAIESGSVDFVDNELPCIYKDITGLGRPQDFDLDGVFTCDRGAVEVQGGADIGAPQTAAFFDTGRNGEGVFVEILDGGMAVISFYTYNLDGTTLAWYMGLGRVVGNSVVIDEMQKVTGGIFGAGFDAASIVRTTVGGMSLVFPNCLATTNPGRLNFTARSDSGLENLLQEATRLTFIVNCDGSKAANAQRSGAFFAPSRSGEGIFVQWLSDGRVVLVVYTFDPAGNPFWVISDAGTTVVNGNTVTAPMLYAQGKTRFGINFNASEVNLAPWGTITLTYTDDNNLTFAYDSTVAGFGAGNHAYTRLTQPAGTVAVVQGN